VVRHPRSDPALEGPDARTVVEERNQGIAELHAVEQGLKPRLNPRSHRTGNWAPAVGESEDRGGVHVSAPGPAGKFRGLRVCFKQPAHPESMTQEMDIPLRVRKIRRIKPQGKGPRGPMTAGKSEDRGGLIKGGRTISWISFTFNT